MYQWPVNLGTAPTVISQSMHKVSLTTKLLNHMKSLLLLLTINSKPYSPLNILQIYLTDFISMTRVIVLTFTFLLTLTAEGVIMPNTLGPDEFVKKITADPVFFISLLKSQDVKKETLSLGYDLPDNFIAYIESSLEKIKVYIIDQSHVLETKSNLLVQPMGIANTRSGNGAAGTGW
ncbi:hypothetical protein [Klebsiella quasipneumoniae]|uniref:hypothetical protein n=1 Tax=Klebsiella quasipneumoniae TaxID=1463165 RepID=UPI0034DE8433